jgi:NADH-quinone oxidoreductase subunit I
VVEELVVAAFVKNADDYEFGPPIHIGSYGRLKFEMIVKRKPLNFWERLYLPAMIGGFKVTLRHFFKRKVTMQYPEEKWVVPEGYRGAPYLVRDQDGNTKCVSCQLCEFICPPKAIKIIPPGPTGPLADRPNAEKMPLEFEINMLRCIFCGFCQEVCPEEAIFLQKDYSLTGTSRAEMIYDKEKLLALGGVHGGVQKWKHKLQEAKEQENFPVKV